MTPDQPEPPYDGLTRKRAALVLTSIVAVAVLVVGLMVLFLQSPSKHNPPVTLPSVSVISGSSTPGGHSSGSAPGGSTTSSSSSSAPSTGSSTYPATTSCATSAPCILSGDPGNVVAAINTFRAGHGRPAITGSVTPAAGSCAVHSGDTPNCPVSYFWEPVSKPDGSEVVTKIAAHADGQAWLLDPHLTSVAVGWARGGGLYECTVVDTTNSH